jgi:hypothetical protein
MTYDEWFDTYKPIKNEITQWKSEFLTTFETYGDELAFVQSQPENNIWTELDGDEGVYIVSGFHFVNRIQYYITEKPWTEETSITVCTYIECQNNVEGECEPDCDLCGGDGVITEWKN